jgi:hypothetical protein
MFRRFEKAIDSIKQPFNDHPDINPRQIKAELKRHGRGKYSWFRRYWKIIQAH